MSSLLISSLTSSMSVRILDKHLSVATQGRKVIYFLFNLHYIALVNYHVFPAFSSLCRKKLILEIIRACRKLFLVLMNSLLAYNCLAL